MRTIDELGISTVQWSVWHKSKSRVKDGHGNSIADCGGSIDYSVADAKINEAIANARLIAAAPELYKALFDLVLYGETILDWDVAPTHIKASVMLKIRNAKNALAKANGEEVK